LVLCTSLKTLDRALLQLLQYGQNFREAEFCRKVLFISTCIEIIMYV